MYWKLKSKIYLFMLLIASVGIATAVEEIKEHDNYCEEKVLKDLEVLINASDDYYRDIGHYPENEEGLDALVSRHISDNEPYVRHSYGYLMTLPVDPWGRDYHYHKDERNGDLSFFSDGADTLTGTEDDIRLVISGSSSKEVYEGKVAPY